MKNSESLRIAIAETSIIIRSGVTAALKRLPNLKVKPIEVLSYEALSDCLSTQFPQMLIINPSFKGYFDVKKFREEYHAHDIRLIALVTSFVDETLLSRYDVSVSIFDDLDIFSSKLESLLHSDEKLGDEEHTDALSQREKEVLLCIIKGMTNKEIAEKLYLSIHTVITHRRNIGKKLQIHSISGLTIYAIVNKLVSLSDIRNV